MIYENLPAEDYFAIEAASNSGLKLVRRSPAHFKYKEEKDPTPAMAMGTHIHMALLEPERFASHYVVAAEAVDKRSAYYKGLVKDVGADRVLTIAEHRKLVGMQDAAYRNKRFAGYMKAQGRNELSVVTKDPATGVAVKCRFDRKGDSGWALLDKRLPDLRIQCGLLTCVRVKEQLRVSTIRQLEPYSQLSASPGADLHRPARDRFAINIMLMA